MIRSIAGSIARPLAVAITGASGGAAPAPVDAYAANGFSPAFVVDETVDSAPFYRSGGSTVGYSDIYTTDTTAGGLCTQNDSSGNLVWGPHNGLTYSEDISNAAWIKGQGSVSADAGTAPDGQTTADKFTPNTSTSSHNFYQTGVATHNALAFFAKTDGYDFVQVITNDGADGYVNFDVANGSVGNSSAMTGAITSAGSGWYLCVATGLSAVNGFCVVLNADTASRNPTYAGDGTSGVLFWGLHRYRSDLGGMADVPSDVRDYADAAKYIATTTAAKYLIRRRHYRYNGTSYVPTLLHEPVGATNTHDYSRDFTAGSWSGGTPTANAVGIDGVSNSAHTITDSKGAGFTLFSHTARTAPANTSDWVATYHVKKTTSATTFPGVTLIFGGTDAYSATINTNTGVVTARTTQVPDKIYVSDGEEYWRVSIVGANTNSRTTVAQWTYPAVESGTVTGTWSSSVTGSCVIDQYDLVNASVPSSPIITTGASVTRSADTCKVKAAALPYDSTNISMAVTGRYSSPDFANVSFASWRQDASNRLTIGTIAPQIVAAVVTGGTVEVAVGGVISGGNRVAIKAATRAVGSDAIQEALNGTATAEETATMPALPPLSDDDLSVSEIGGGGQELNGEVDTLILWSDDVGTAGIEATTS